MMTEVLAGAVGLIDHIYSTAQRSAAPNPQSAAAYLFHLNHI